MNFWYIQCGRPSKWFCSVKEATQIKRVCIVWLYLYKILVNEHVITECRLVVAWSWWSGGGRMKLLWFIVVMLSWVCTYGKAYQSLQFRYMQIIVHQLHLNLHLNKAIKRREKEEKEPWILWFLAVDRSLQDTSKSSKIWEYLSNLEICTGNSRSHNIFQGLYKLKEFLKLNV